MRNLNCQRLHVPKFIIPKLSNTATSTNGLPPALESTQHQPLHCSDWPCNFLSVSRMNLLEKRKLHTMLLSPLGTLVYEIRMLIPNVFPEPACGKQFQMFIKLYRHLGNSTYYCTGNSKTMRQFVSTENIIELSIP